MKSHEAENSKTIQFNKTWLYTLLTEKQLYFKMTSWRGWTCWPSCCCYWYCMLTKCYQQLWSV